MLRFIDEHGNRCIKINVNPNKRWKYMGDIQSKLNNYLPNSTTTLEAKNKIDPGTQDVYHLIYIRFHNDKLDCDFFIEAFGDMLGEMESE